MQIGQFIPLTKLPRNLGCFDYQVESKLAAQLKLGQVIKIPFGKRQVWGCFNGFITKSNFANIKTIEKIEPLTELDEFQLEFLNWFSKYYYYSLGSTFKLMQPELPLKKQGARESKEKIDDFVKIDLKTNIQAQKLANTILTGTEKKYWLADFDKSLKWSLYLELIKNSTKQIFILFPEVSSAQNFYQSLPAEIQAESRLAIGDSMKTKNKAYQIWSDIKNSKCKLVIGTRSTCFYLTENIGTVVVDSAESDDYKQWDQAPYYDSIEVLRQAQSILKNTLILTTTKPRIDDTFVFKQEQYQYISLGEKQKQNIVIVDMKKEQKRKFFFLSYQAEAALDDCIEQNKQALIIVNKVGLFSKLVCSDCGYEAHCEKCELPLMVNEQDELECRHCKLTTKTPIACPKCGNIKLQGRGAGLAQIKKELSQLYTCSEDLTNKKAQVLLSTGQYMNISELKNIDVAVFAYFDSLIYLTDFNSNFRLYNFVQNVIEGLNKPQKIIIQTHFPDNEVFKYINNDYSILYNNEILSRKEHNYPPFCTLIKLFFQHHDKKICSTEADRLYVELLPRIKSISGSITEPYLYYLNKIRKRYRYILTIKLPPCDLNKENEMLSVVPDFWSIDKNPKDLL